MPKHGWLTPKAIGNRIKAKGLQKLRWYCQMCQKQCRDENGFKCHMMSESHQRQLLLVADNPGKYVYAFSEEFLRDFMQLLRLQYGTRRVHCNEVYQEYIKDKNHFHMNATRWVTLTGFVQWLGRQGICEVEPTPKGWYIKYIDRSPEALARQTAAAKKGKMDKDDEERTQKMIEQQISRALASKGSEEDVTPTYTELKREDEGEKLTFTLFKDAASGPQVPEEGIKDERDQPCSSDAPPPPPVGSDPVGAVGGDGCFSRKKPALVSPLALPNALSASTSSKGKEKEDGGGARKRRAGDERGGRPSEAKRKKLTALEELRLMEEERKERVNRRDDWVREGIVVKVVHRKLGERYHRKKGVVEEVRERFTAIVRMLDCGDKIKIDQANLETVIPAIGKPVMVVNGAYRGLRAVLESVDVDNFCVSIRIDQGPSRDRVVDRVAYEDISKLA